MEFFTVILITLLIMFILRARRINHFFFGSLFQISSNLSERSIQSTLNLEQLTRDIKENTRNISRGYLESVNQWFTTIKKLLKEVMEKQIAIIKSRKWEQISGILVSSFIHLPVIILSLLFDIEVTKITLFPVLGVVDGDIPLMGNLKTILTAVGVMLTPVCCGWLVLETLKFTSLTPYSKKWKFEENIIKKTDTKFLQKIFYYILAYIPRMILLGIFIWLTFYSLETLGTYGAKVKSILMTESQSLLLGKEITIMNPDIIAEILKRITVTSIMLCSLTLFAVIDFFIFLGIICLLFAIFGIALTNLILFLFKPLINLVFNIIIKLTGFLISIPVWLTALLFRIIGLSFFILSRIIETIWNITDDLLMITEPLAQWVDRIAGTPNNQERGDNSNQNNPDNLNRSQETVNENNSEAVTNLSPEPENLNNNNNSNRNSGRNNQIENIDSLEAWTPLS